MKLGARVVKTALAVVLVLYVTDWLNLAPPMLVVIAAVLTTQPSVYRSFKFFLEQLQANIIGAVFSIFGLFLLGNHPMAIGLVVIFVIVANLLLKLESSIGLAILTVLAVMYEPDGAINRFLLIMFGVTLSIVVNALVMPPNHERKLLERFQSLNEHILLLMRNLLDFPFEERSLRREKDAIMSELKRAEEAWELYKEDRPWLWYGRNDQRKPQKLVIYKHLLSVLRKEASLIRNEHRQLPKQMQEKVQQHLDGLAQYHELIYLKLEGKIRAKQPRDEHEKLFAQNRGLLETLQAMPIETTEQARPLIFVTRLTDILIELDQLDKWVNRYRLQAKGGNAADAG